MLADLLLPALSVGGLALIFGAILGFSAKKFYVKTDPKVDGIIGLLPGVNCGGCGYPGCAVFAKAVVQGEASYKGCPVGGASVATEIANSMGIDATESSRKVAFVRCNGTCDDVKRNYIYDGPESCVAASQLATGGNKACTYGCMGLASCQHACPFHAIKMVDSVAVIDSKKCTACGKCVAVCPKKLIEIIPDSSKVRVLCNSEDKGRLVRVNCRAGCLGCKICQKACNADAITVENEIAHIDYEKCTMCMVCIDKCPSKAIKLMQ